LSEIDQETLEEMTETSSNLVSAERILSNERRKSRQIVNYASTGNCLFNSGYCEAVVRYRALGKSLKSFAAQIGVTVETVKRWGKTNEEFKRALELSEEAAQGYWEEIAHGQATGELKGGSTTAMTFVMKNQFSEDYKDKQEVEHSGDLTFIIDTGIKRDTELNTIEAESSVIEDDSDLL